MLYEYTFDNLPGEEIENMLINSKEVRRVGTNSNYFIVTISGILIMLILFILNNYKWSNYNIIIIVCYIISMLMTKFKKGLDVTPIYKKIEDISRNKLRIEIDSDVCMYHEGKFTANLNKSTVIEVLTSENNTLIILTPRKLKIFFIYPIVIKNNIFETEERYNEFINRISK